MRPTTVGDEGGGVWHWVLVCRGGEERGGWYAGGGCFSRCLIVLSCCQGKKFHEGYEGGGQVVPVVVPPAVGMGILSIVAVTERAQESFRIKMHECSLYNDKK